MKKLSGVEIKKIKGGQPPFCERVCNYEYQACVLNENALLFAGTVLIAGAMAHVNVLAAALYPAKRLQHSNILKM